MRFFMASFIALLTCALAAGVSSANTAPSPAPTAIPIGTPIKFLCQWTQRNRMSTPWTGDMTIRDNAEGIINGTYRSTSIKPDPFYGKIITVTGAVNGKNVRLTFGIVPNVTVSGELVKGGIHGRTTMNGGSLEFVAAVAPKQ